MTPSKRVLDIILSFVGLLVVAPLTPFLYLLVKWFDGGSLFFIQKRVGYKGKIFHIYKVRTMRVHWEGDVAKFSPHHPENQPLTVEKDERITSLGEFLRKFKIDEIPQLWNVLKGEMTFVGPRPEVPYFVNFYSQEQKKVLDLVPGITDMASIKYRNESFILSQHKDPHDYYVKFVMADKIKINLEYAAQATLLKDLGVIFKTLDSLRN